jgi:HAD superfamily hydrolase (TIGR01509 family)
VPVASATGARSVVLSIRAVIFDRDGVLTYFDLAPLLTLVESLPGIGLEALYKRWVGWCTTHPVPHESEHERALVSGFWDEVIREWDLDAATAERLRRFDYLQLLKAFDDVHPALASLRQHGLRIGVLSNAGAPTMQASLDAVGLSSMVDLAVAAPVIGCAKPDAAAYEHVLHGLGLDAAEAIFVDDDATNVAGARAIGMRGVLLDRAGPAGNPPDTVRDLRDLAAYLGGDHS